MSVAKDAQAHDTAGFVYKRSHLAIALALCLGAMGTVSTAQAEAVQPQAAMSADSDVNPADLPEADQSIKAAPASQWTGMWSRSNMLGDMGGLRSLLGRNGMTLGLSETSEYLSNVGGGLEHGGSYQGLTTLTLGLDTQLAGLWDGGNANISVLDIHGRQFTSQYVGSLQTASGIEAENTARLWEAWYQQKFFNGQVDIKVGQQSIDQEFIVSQYGATFVGTMFGWPAVPSYDMVAGGPAYPLSSLGVRLRAHLGSDFTFLSGLFDGNPARNSQGDAQQLDNHGTTFSHHGGGLWLNELQYAINQPVDGALDNGKGKNGLPGTYRIGFWYQNAQTADQRYDDNGLSLSNPASDGNAAQHNGNYSVYAIADQMVWRPAEDSSRTLNVFGRVMSAPGDRNLISFSANAGMTLTAPFDGRDNDVAGLALGYVRVGNHARELDQDTAQFNSNPAYPVRSDETFLEATYQYQLTPWWQLQADLQYTIKPGAGVVLSSDASQTQRIPNAWVVGLRTNITF